MKLIEILRSEANPPESPTNPSQTIPCFPSLTSSLYRFPSQKTIQSFIHNIIILYKGKRRDTFVTNTPTILYPFYFLCTIHVSVLVSVLWIKATIRTYVHIHIHTHEQKHSYKKKLSCNVCVCVSVCLYKVSYINILYSHKYYQSANYKTG